MQTYRKPSRGFRPIQIEAKKVAKNQMRNMGGIVNNMGRLMEHIDNFPQTLTADTMLETANEFNKREHLSLTEDQINIVLRKYTKS